MAKLMQISDETLKLINNTVEDAGLTQYINVMAFGVTKQSQIIKIAKASATVEYVSNLESTVIFYVYEEAFNMLNQTAKGLLMRDAVNTIEYDLEKDKISIAAPQISVTLGGRAKYGEDLVNACEAAVYAMKQIEEKKKDK